MTEIRLVQVYVLVVTHILENKQHVWIKTKFFLWQTGWSIIKFHTRFHSIVYGPNRNGVEEVETLSTSMATTWVIEVLMMLVREKGTAKMPLFSTTFEIICYLHYARNTLTELNSWSSLFGLVNHSIMKESHTDRVILLFEWALLVPSLCPFS